jgi:tRNA(fMet)-specific endonuclease VapC
VTEAPDTAEPPRHRHGILDTSTVMLLSRISDPAALPAEPLISAVTLAELTVGPLVAATDAERAARQAHVQQAEADFDPLRAPSDRWPPRCAARAASPPPAHTTP